MRVDDKVVILPKIGKVAMVEHPRFAGSIREVTVDRTPGTWFARCCVEAGEGLSAVQSGPTIGSDVGVGLMATCSDGTTVENPKALDSGIKRLRRPDRAIARSRNVHGRGNHSNRLSRAIADAGMAGFPAKLGSKCTWYGAEFVKADRWFASSKLCAHCGWKNDDLHLRYRQWRCGGCGALNETDHNAAMHLSNWPGLSFPVSGHGDRVSPATPAVVGEASTAAPGQSPIESLEQTG